MRGLGLEYPILADPTLATIEAYGLVHRAAHDGRDIALSASVLIDGEGVVRWTSVARNFRVRPTPETVLAALDAMLRAGPSPSAATGAVGIRSFTGDVTARGGRT